MLSKVQKQRLRRAGFVKEEIDKLNRDMLEKPQTVDLNTGTWQSVMAGRRNWIRQQRKKGWSDIQIKVELFDFYRATGLTPWFWLKVEYHPPTSMPQTKYRKARKRRVDRLLEQGFYWAAQYQPIGPKPTGLPKRRR